MTGLVNGGGTQVVAYTYDAWGNSLTTTGSMAATLGKLNPFAISIDGWSALAILAFGVKVVELPSQVVGQFVPIG